MTHHITPLRTYIAIWLLLIFFTFTTAWVAFFNMGSWNIVVAMTIAVVKMLLVVLYFMHVKYNDSLTRLFVAAGFFWLVILIVMTMMDYFSRSWQVSPRI